MIESVIERWHRHLRNELDGGFEELLADDVVFYSPILYTPQVGKSVTTMYLSAALETLIGVQKDDSAAGSGDARRFAYTKEIMSGDTAVLEFETSVGGKYVNGVDIIRCNEDGRIVEFRVMLRPLQAINTVSELMKAAIDAAAG